jgi:glycosyltransferase involved in cell wall biosynthesis
VEFILCGQGDATPYLSNNLIYKPPIHGDERSLFLGDCVAFLYPTIYLEPFGGGAVEAQLCGTPVICSDFGAMTETVEQFKTGLRCHTLSDYCHGIQMALDNHFDRTYIRERAANLYDMYKVAFQYEYVFKSIREIYVPGNNGWYSPVKHIKTFVEKSPVEEINPRIYIFVAYYGSFPNYFQLYLDSLANNTDCLTVFLVTDIDMSSYTCPENLIIIFMPKADLQARVSKFIEEGYQQKVAPENLLVDNYKIVDIKIIYPILFDDLMKEYKVTEKDFVGWGDIDLIYGKMSNFINFSDNYGIIGGWHGHFTAIKNETEFKNNYKQVHDYLSILTDNSKTYIADEIAYRQPLIDYIEKHKVKMFFTNAHFCDIIPPCLFHLSRPNWKSYKKNFYDLYNPTKNIQHVHYNKKLVVQYDDGTSREAFYCHIQKRKMALPFTKYTSYYINETGFSVIPLMIWQTWHTQDLPPKMAENIEELKQSHSTFKHTLMDTGDCRKFIENNSTLLVFLIFGI